ncbi:MAG: glycosyltransferase [Desulfovibrionaceae bacterium]|nr:glycosyltransferase [Desulfovibrionaceae bacterium]
MAIKSFIKKCWKKTPLPIREAVLALLCCAHAQKRFSVAEKKTVTFVFGAFRSSSGLAQGARLYADKKEKEGACVIRVDVTDAMVQRADFLLPENVVPLEQALAMPENGTVVIHANPPQFQLVLCKLGKQFLANKRIIGYWAWELEEIPSIWEQALDYVDAVEVPSTFVQAAISKHTNKEVTVVPHDVPVPARRKERYAEDGIVRCLYCFDMSSAFMRKNPLAALQAFSLAFKDGEAELTFKVSNVQADPNAFDAFKNACTQVPCVHIITQAMTSDELTSLYCQNDIYLSLHRSEGYGLTIREAMLCGLHIVATGWSGNMDFMTGELAHPVPYTLIPLKEVAGTFKGLESRWADVDIKAAATILRALQLEFLKRY